MRSRILSGILLASGLASAFDKPKPSWDDVPWAVPSADLVAGEYRYDTTISQTGRSTFPTTRTVTVTREKNGWKIEDKVPDIVHSTALLEPKSLLVKEWKSTLGAVWQGSLKFGNGKMSGSYQHRSQANTPFSGDVKAPILSVRQRHTLELGDKDKPDSRLVEFANDEFQIAALPLTPEYQAGYLSFQMASVETVGYVVTVAGSERVTVPAGTFDCFKVEAESTEQPPWSETVWVSKDLRIPVKTLSVQPQGHGEVVRVQNELRSPESPAKRDDVPASSSWNELPWAVPSAPPAAGEYSYTVTVQSNDPARYLRKITVADNNETWNIRDAWDTAEPLAIVASYVLDRNTLAVRSWKFENGGAYVMGAEVFKDQVTLSAAQNGKLVKRSIRFQGSFLSVRMQFDESNGAREFAEFAVASLPLAPRYKARLQSLSVNNLRPFRYVVEATGAETVTTAGGTFECVKTELHSLDDPDTQTSIWISRSRAPVKIVSISRVAGGGLVETTSELTSKR